MQVIAVVNHKGGAAKTTTAVNLSSALAARKRRVLVIDLDPQASASLWLGERVKGERFLDSVVTGEGLHELVRPTASHVDLISSGPAFASFEKIAAGGEGCERLLRRALDDLPHSWDYVLLDSPPSLGLTTVNTLVAADHALVPVVAQVLSIEPLARLLDTMWRVRETLQPALQLLGIFACRVDHRTNHSREVIRLLERQFAPNLLQTAIRENVHVAEAAGYQKPVITYAPRSNGARDYIALAEEVESRLDERLEKTLVLEAT